MFPKNGKCQDINFKKSLYVEGLGTYFEKNNSVRFGVVFEVIFDAI
jgi:hypothetical protein